MARRDKSARRSSMRDKVRQRAEENKYSGGGGYLRLPEGIKFAKLKKGTNELDILPFEIKSAMTIPDTATKDMDLDAGDLWYQRSIFVHHGIGADQKSYLCPRTIKKACPICEERARLMKDPNADEKLISDLKPQHKDLFNIDGADGVELLEFSYANFRKKIEEEVREGDEEWAGFADLEGGFTVKVRMSEETFMKNKYLEASRVDFVERDDFPESVLDEVADLNEILVVLPYEKLERVFLELDGEEEEPDGQEPEPEGKPSRSRGRSRTEPEEEPEPEPRRGRGRSRQEPEEEEPEPEKPSRGRGRSRTEPEEEPEPEKPTRSRRSRPEPEEEPEPEPEKPSRGRGRTRNEPEQDDAGKSDDPPFDVDECPHGGTWGEDCDKLDQCFECDKWEACRDAADALKGSRRR